MRSAPMEPLWDLVEEALEESSFLWGLWEADLSSLTRTLEDVWSWTEDRLQGALDGARVAGERLPEMLEPMLRGKSPSQLSVAAHLLAARTSPRALGQLATFVRGTSGERLWAMIRGIEAAELDATFAPVTTALASGGPEHQAALCRLRAFRRSQPGQEAVAAFESQQPQLQVHALLAFAHARDESADRYIVAGLESEDPAVRRAAIESGVRRRQAVAWAEARSRVRERSPESGPFLSLLATLGSPEDHDLITAALREPSLQRAGLFALGYVGTPEAVSVCHAALRDPKLARSAGEAYCAITGADLQRDGLAAPEPEEADSLPPLEAESLDESLIPAAHELWPLPDPDAIRRHWESVKSRYTASVRHLYGRPVDLGVLVDAIENGPMLRRPGLITELSIRTAGRYDVEPRAFAHVQRRMMAAGRSNLR